MSELTGEVFRAEPLTPRETGVLRLVAEGLSNDALGAQLNISKSTVRTHLRNISVKLAARNRTQAVAIARRLGVLDDGRPAL